MRLAGIRFPGKSVTDLTARSVRRCCQRIGDLEQCAVPIECLRKIALTLQFRRYGNAICEGRSLAQAFPVEKPEHLVLDDRPADRGTVLVESEYWARRTAAIGEELFAFSLSLRKNSYRLPWRSFVPLFVVTLTYIPPPWPYSASSAFVCTVNSSTSSTLGM